MSQSQLGFPLKVPPVYAAGDFVVSTCNRAAYERIKQWRETIRPVLVLHGPAASGKTHLAHIWAKEAEAIFLPSAELANRKIASLLVEQPSGHYIIDDLEQLAEESALFHLLNAIHAHKGRLLLIGKAAPSQLGFQLPDLVSRLNAMPAVHLEAPDDTLLRAVLVKQFADRQLRVGEEVIRYLLLRMDRTFDSAREWVDRIDREALASQRKVTVAWLRNLMEKE